MSDEKKPIVIKKIKKGGHGGHHGGAWKVAYADFVTAMMAFFLLLWLLSSVPQEKLNGLADFFSPTVGIKDQKGIGTKGGISNIENGSKRSDSGTASIVFGAPSEGDVLQVKKVEDQKEKHNFIKFQNDFNDAIQQDKSLKQYVENIHIDETPDGLRIQLIDTKNRPMFVANSNELQPYTKELLAKISAIVRYLPNYISIIGHTTSIHANVPIPVTPNPDAEDSGTPPAAAAPANAALRTMQNVAGTDNTLNLDLWQLSSDRSIATRAYLLTTNLDKEQVAQVVGRGDHDPFDINNPAAPENIRLELILLKDSVMAYKHNFGDNSISLKQLAD